MDRLIDESQTDQARCKFRFLLKQLAGCRCLGVCAHACMRVYICTLPYITLHYIALRQIALHCTTLITLHYITLHYITLHCIT